MWLASAAGSFWHWPTWADIGIGVGLFILTAGLSLAVTAWILIRLPANYFVGPTAPAFWSDRHPILQWFGRAGKNLLGAALIIIGIVLSLPGVPGQGLLTILIGLLFLDIPGKRKLEQRLVRQPRILAAVNALRRRGGAGELRFDPPGHSTDPGDING